MKNRDTASAQSTGAAKQAIRLLIVDDHELVRDGIRSRLESQSTIEIVGEATDGHQAVDLAKSLKPDLVLMDINMPNLGGLDAVEHMKSIGLQCRILILSLYDNAEYVKRAMALGTNGYLLKDIGKTEMIEAIKSAAAGEFYIDKRLALSLSEALDAGEQTSPASAQIYNLTGRECEILRKISQGKLNKEIASDLNISTRTVESHRSSIRKKTGGGNAATLSKIAIELGLS